MASQSTNIEPEDAAAAAEPADQAPSEAPPASAAKRVPLVAEYLDTTSRTYLFDGAPPQTAEKGDVCLIPYDPGDGRWAPSKRKVTRLPDNHPDQAAITSAAQTKARNELHARLAAEQAAAAAGEA